MTHNVTWPDPTITPGEWTAETDTDNAIMHIDGVTPSGATPINWMKHLGTLIMAIRRLGHTMRGWAGMGHYMRRDFPPPFNPGGAVVSLAPQAQVTITVMAGRSLYIAEDTRNLVWLDWRFEQEGHDLDGQAMRSMIQPGDVFEIDAVRALGYTLPDGTPAIQQTPGKNFLITNVDHETGLITVHEPNLPYRTTSANTTAELTGYIRRFVQEPGANDFGHPPILKEGDPVDIEGNLNLETRVCKHDRFVFHALWDRKSDDTLGKVEDYLYNTASGLRECKTCLAVDELNRLDNDGANSPYNIYSTHRRNQAAVLGPGGPTVYMCDGNAGACTRFESVTAPASCGGPHGRLASLVNGTECVGVQAIIGFPYMIYFWTSPPSLAQLLGPWWVTGGGTPTEKIVITGVAGGSGAIVDERAHDDGTGTLEGYYGSSLRRPEDTTDTAEALARSACARFLPANRTWAPNGGNVDTMHIDQRCDLSDGVNTQGYIDSGFFANESNYADQRIDADALYTVSPITVGIDVGVGETAVVVPTAIPSPDTLASSETTLNTYTIAGNHGDDIVFTAEDGVTLHADRAVGTLIENYGDQSSAWHNSIKRKILPRDVLKFSSSVSVPIAVRGKSFAVSAISNDPISDLDHVTLVEPDGTAIATGGLTGVDVTHIRGALKWVPGSTVVVQRRDGNGSLSTLTEGVDYTLDPADSTANITLTTGGHADGTRLVVTLHQAMLRYNPCRERHLTEIRTLIESATTLELGLSGGADLIMTIQRRVVNQLAGTENPLWPTMNAPGWGPIEFMSADVVADILPGSYSYGHTWTTALDEEGYYVQKKQVALPVWALPDNLHFYTASHIQDAYIWVKVTEDPSNNLSSGAVVAGVVRRHRDGSDERCANGYIQGHGSCKGQTAEYDVGLMGRTAKVLTAPPPAATSPGYPDGSVAGPTGWISNQAINQWVTNCNEAASDWSSLWGADKYDTASGFTSGLMMRGGPWTNDSYWDGAAWQFRNKVSPTQANADLAGVDEPNALNCKYFQPVAWSPTLEIGGTLTPNGKWQKLDITDALKRAMSVPGDEEIGIVIGYEDAIRMGLGTTTGDWLDYTFDDAISGDTLDRPFYEDFDGVGRITLDQTHKTKHGFFNIEVKRAIIVRYDDEYTPGLPVIANLPGIEAPAP